ncbi:Nucleoside diphosphate kinase B [Lemmus lemmus]
MQRGLVGEIIKRFEQKGFRLVAVKCLRASEEHRKQHYIDLKGPVVATVWEGLNVMKIGRMMLGETNPADSKPAPFEGIFAFKLAGTSFMAVIQCKAQRKRSVYGLSLKN